VLSSGVAHVIVVTGHDAEAVRMALDGLDVSFTHNPDFATGMASSLRAGLAALPADTDAALICLGDMPAVSPGDIAGLVSAFEPDEHRSIIIPTNRGKRGNPVLFSRQFFVEMAAGSGDTGARNLLNAYPEAIFEVEMASAAVLADADTPAAFEALQAEFGKAGHT
jgi:molybdenum cofactor cytidylyltransferase